MATVPETNGADPETWVQGQPAAEAPSRNGIDAEAAQSSAALPPAMAAVKERSVDDVLKEMNRVPLFMTSLDEGDGEDGDNVGLEALKALAYEGTRAEVAANFREQGNEQARSKNWTDAKEFYSKALVALKGPQQYNPNPDVEVAEIDEAAEQRKELDIEEACHANRALCNLEKSKRAPPALRVFRFAM
jgi:hypothetical protein